MTQEIRETLRRIHANHQLSKVVLMICETIDNSKEEQKEIREKLAELEEKK